MMSSENTVFYKFYHFMEFKEPQSPCFHSSFSQTHKVGNVGIIANFVFPYICGFLLYLHQLMLVNVKLEIKGQMGITF